MITKAYTILSDTIAGMIYEKILTEANIIMVFIIFGYAMTAGVSYWISKMFTQEGTSTQVKLKFLGIAVFMGGLLPAALLGTIGEKFGYGILMLVPMAIGFNAEDLPRLFTLNAIRPFINTIVSILGRKKLSKDDIDREEPKHGNRRR